MSKAYRLAVITSDKYIRALRPFSALLKKYWPDGPDVVVGGYTPPDFPLPHNWEFVSIGKFYDYPVSRWSDGLIDFLNIIPDEVVMLALEDMWPIRPVFSVIIDMAYDYMQQFRYVARFDLTSDRQFAQGVSFYGKMGGVNLLLSDPDSQYQLSMMPAFWRKEHLLRVLIPNETPWDVELSGTPRLSALRNEMIVLGTDVHPYKNCLAFRGGDTSKLILNELDPQDVAMMRGAGLFKGLE
jgi:hypothetical protein